MFYWGILLQRTGSIFDALIQRTVYIDQCDTAPENLSIYSFIEYHRLDLIMYEGRTNKGCHVHAMCKMFFLWA